MFEIMKKGIYIMFAGLSLSLFGCSFLDVEKIGKSDIESFYDSPESVTAAVTGCLSLLNTLTDKYMVIYPEVSADMVVMSGEESLWTYIYNGDLSESYNASPIGFIWKSAYEIVLNACEVIDYAPSVIERYPSQTAAINEQIARARYCRALATLDIVLCYAQHYGYTQDASHLGAVVMGSFPNLNSVIVRSSTKDTYDFILKDLQTAASLFTEDKSPDPHYPSRAAAEALLARVYLYMDDCENALRYAENLINNYDFTLTPRDGYFDMYTTISQTGSESIFRLDGYDCNRSLTSAYDYQKHYLLPSANLTALFTEDEDSAYPDVRYSLINYDGKSGSKGCTMKYTILEDVSDKEKSVDVFVSRLSEMYLIRAEALCRLGRSLDTAAGDIAKLRSRATGRHESDCIPASSDASSLFEAVKRERAKELFHEGFRLFDIARWKEDLVKDPASTSAVKSLTYPSDNFVLPIPGVEMEANKQMQPNPNNETQR